VIEERANEACNLTSNNPVSLYRACNSVHVCGMAWDPSSPKKATDEKASIVHEKAFLSEADAL
jgi:hypothetical protein